MTKLRQLAEFGGSRLGTILSQPPLEGNLRDNAAAGVQR
jgi:hypothetical protein